MASIYCACCGRKFERPSSKGPAPQYCSDDCRRQMAVRRAAWAHMPKAEAVNPHGYVNKG